MTRQVSFFLVVALMLSAFLVAQPFAETFSNKESHIQESIGVKTTPDRQEKVEYPAPQVDSGMIRIDQDSFMQDSIGTKANPDQSRREELVITPQPQTGVVRRSQESLIQESIGTKTTPTDRAGGTNIYRRGSSSETVYGPRAYYGEETASRTERLDSSNMLGQTIVSSRGETFGVIEDVVYGRDGRIDYVIVSRDAARDQMIPVPWRTLRPGDREGMYIVNMERDRFEAAPSFSRTDQPDFTSREWNQRVYGYYGIEYLP